MLQQLAQNMKNDKRDKKLGKGCKPSNIKGKNHHGVNLTQTVQRDGCDRVTVDVGGSTSRRRQGASWTACCVTGPGPEGLPGP